MKTISLCSGIALALLISALHAPSQLVLNGDFQTGGWSDWTLSGDTNNGTFSIDSCRVDSGGTPGSPISGIIPYSGGYGGYEAAFETSGTSGDFIYLSQTLNNLAATNYLLTFWLGANYSPSGNSELQVFWNTNIIFDWINVNGQSDQSVGWTNIQLSITNMETNATLQIGIQHDSYLDLDDINVSVPPANDAFTNRTPLQGVEFGNNFGATLEPKEPNPGGTNWPVSNTVWWSWTAPTNGPASVLTSGSGFDTIIDVYTGNTLTNLTLVASNLNTTLDYEFYSLQQSYQFSASYPSGYNPLNAGIPNRVGFAAQAGTNYQIQVSGLREGPIEILTQPVALKVLSVTQTKTNADGSVPFSATVEVGNSGNISPGPLRLDVFASAGFISQPQITNFAQITPTPSQTLYFTNLAPILPGATNTISLTNASLVCPPPQLVVENGKTNLIFAWVVYVALQQQVGTNWFFNDQDLLFYGQWPESLLTPESGLSAGVVSVNPSVSGDTLSFGDAIINGPTLVNQKSTNNYYGTAVFTDGVTTTNFVNFTNTVWTASRFNITTNGVFQTGSVSTNTPVTLTTYYSYDWVGSERTNSSQLSVLVLASGNPSISDWSFHTNKTLSLALNALPKSEFEIQSATNLAKPQWIPLATNATDTNGVWFFTDTKDTNGNQRFYRASEVQ